MPSMWTSQTSGFRFRELPAGECNPYDLCTFRAHTDHWSELRNHIYDHVVERRPKEEQRKRTFRLRHVRPTSNYIPSFDVDIALAHVSRQLRAEFRPIWLRSCMSEKVCMNYLHVECFVKTFGIELNDWVGEFIVRLIFKDVVIHFNTHPDADRALDIMPLLSMITGHPNIEFACDDPDNYHYFCTVWFQYTLTRLMSQGRELWMAELSTSKTIKNISST
jgi:hypothetical protein